MRFLASAVDPAAPLQLVLFTARWLKERRRPAHAGQRPRPPKRKHQLRHPLTEPPRPIQLRLYGDPVALVECVRVGKKVRVRPASPDFDTRIWCQFPRRLRVAGARFLVEHLVLVEQEGRAPFYRVAGVIQPQPLRQMVQRGCADG